MITHWKQIKPQIALLLVQLMLPLCATAEQTNAGFLADAITVDYGTGNETRLARLNAQWNWDKSWFDSGDSHLTGYWDASIALWDARDWDNVNGRSRTLYDVGFTPVFRLENDSRHGWFFDGGVGPNLLSMLYENRRRNFSTAFQFGDLIGVGYQSEHWVAGVTLEHFSNGAIKHPNPGANFALITIGYRFQAN